MRSVDVLRNVEWIFSTLKSAARLAILRSVDVLRGLRALSRELPIKRKSLFKHLHIYIATLAASQAGFQVERCCRDSLHFYPDFAGFLSFSGICV